MPQSQTKRSFYYQGDYHYLLDKDTIFIKNEKFGQFKLNSDTTQYYGSFHRRYFPIGEELSFNSQEYIEETLDGKPARKLWTELVPFFIGFIFILLGSVFYWIGKIEK